MIERVLLPENLTPSGDLKPAKTDVLEAACDCCCNHGNLQAQPAKQGRPLVEICIHDSFVCGIKNYARKAQVHVQHTYLAFTAT